MLLTLLPSATPMLLKPLCPSTPPPSPRALPRRSRSETALADEPSEETACSAGTYIYQLPANAGSSSSLIAAPELRPTSSRRHDGQKSAPLRSIPSHQDSPGTHSLNLFTRAAFAEEESKRRKTSMYHQEERQDYRTTQAWSLESASLYLPTLHHDDPRMQECQMDDSCSSSPELSRSPDSLGNSTDEEYDEAGDSSSDSSAPARSRRVIPLPAPLAASRYIKQLPRPFVRMMDPPRVRQRLYVAMAMETDSGKTNSTWPLEQERENGGWAGRGEGGAGLKVEDLPLNSLGLF